MEKRGGLTGGTGDTNPNRLAIAFPATALATASDATQSLPIPIAEFDARHPVVLELLKIHAFFSPGFDPGLVAPGGLSAGGIKFVTQFIQCTLMEQPSVSSVGSGGVITFFNKIWSVSATSLGSGNIGYTLQESPDDVWIDLTDGAGHGYICPGQFLYLQVANGAANGLPAPVGFIEVYYRFKTIGQEEMISEMITLTSGT